MLTHLHVFQVSLELVRQVHLLLPHIAKHDRNLAEQVTRASPAIPLNVALAAGEGGKSRIHRYRIARGANDKVLATLQVAGCCEMLTREQASTALDLSEQVAALLYPLINEAAGFGDASRTGSSSPEEREGAPIRWPAAPPIVGA